MGTHRTLFIAPTRIGDAVLASSVLRHLHDTRPDSKITILTSPLSAPLYEGYPNLERIFTMVKQPYNRHWLVAWSETIGTRWDAVWDMRNSILTRLVRAGERHCYVTPKLAIPKVHQYQHSFKVAPLPYPMLWPRAEDIAAAETLMPAGMGHLLFAPCANAHYKEWSLANYTALAKLLLDGAYKGYRPVIICAAHERERVLPFIEAVAGYNLLDLTFGELHLLTIYACMQRAQGFFGNDSGLMHMSAASGAPTLALFGATQPETYQPWGPQTAFVQSPEIDLASLTVDDVVRRYATLMKVRAAA